MDRNMREAEVGAGNAGEATIDFLSSRSLIGYTMDATHLFNILQAVINKLDDMEGAVTRLDRRVSSMEADVMNVVQPLQQRVEELDSAIRQVGGAKGLQSVASDIHRLHKQIVEVAAVVDQHSKQQETAAQMSNDMRRGLDGVERAIGDLQRNGLPQADRMLQDVQRMVEGRDAELRGLSSSLRDFEQRFERDVNEIERRERQRHAQEQQREGDIRSQVAAAIDEALGSRLAAQMDELNYRLQESNRQSEIGIKKLDGALGKLHTDIANLRAEVNTVDNDSRHAANRLRDDMEAQFNDVVLALQNFERNNEFMERHITEAGRALTTARAQQQSAAQQLGGGRSSSAYSASADRGSASRQQYNSSTVGDTTTTTTYSRRNLASDLETRPYN